MVTTGPTSPGASSSVFVVVVVVVVFAVFVFVTGVHSPWSVFILSLC